MKTSTLLIAGAGVAGLGFFLLNKANAASAANSVPADFKPPANAIVKTLAPSATTLNVPITVAMWPAESGQPPGNYMMVWNTAKPTTYVVLFYPQKADGTVSNVPAPLAKGSDAGSQALFDQLAAISQGVYNQNIAS